MKITKKSLLISSLLAIIFSSPAYADKKIAVLPFNIPNEQSEIKQFSYGTMAVLTHTLSSFPDYTVIDRGQIDSILKEIGFQKSTFTDESTSIKIGKISGVDILLLGNIQVSNNTYRVNLNVTDVQTGKIIKTFQVTGSEMFQLQDQLAEQLLSLSSSKDILIAKRSSPEAFSLFTQAQENLGYLDIEHIQSAISFFDKSLALDNKYASAIYGKLKAQAMMAYFMKEEGKDYNNLLATIKEIINKVPDSDKENIDYNFAKYFLYKTENNVIAEKGISDKLITIAKNDYVSLITDLGEYYYSNNKYIESEKVLNEAIKIDPTYIYSYDYLATTYSHQGNKEEERIELYNKILKINPNYISALINKGGVYLNQRKYELAMQLYQEALKIEPNSSIVHYSLGQLYLIQNKDDLAIEELRKTIDINKNFSYAYEKIAQIYTYQGKYTEALEYYNKSLTLSHEKDEVYRNIGDLYFSQKIYDQAITNYNKSLDINPKNIFAHASIASTYVFFGKYDQAITKYNEAIKYAEKSQPEILGFLYNGLGGVYQKLQRYDEALAIFAEGLKTNKEYNSIYFSIGETYSMKNDYVRAINTYNELLKMDPSFDYAYYGIAQIYYAQKDYPQTLKHLDMVKKMRNNYTEEKIQNLTFNIYRDMGLAAYSSGKTDQAIDNYNQALKVKPDVSIYNNLGAAYYTKGQYQEAMAQYKRALELKPDHADSHNNLGLTYQILGNSIDADTEYKKACDLGLKSSCK